MPRIVAHKHFVNFQNRAEFPIQCLGIDVRQIKVDLILRAHALAFNADLENFARGDVARDEIAVGRKLLFEEIPALTFRYRRWRSRVAGLSRHPNASAFAARGFRHQSQLVFAGNGSGMDLNELAIRILRALLITSGNGTARANHRVGRLAVN